MDNDVEEFENNEYEEEDDFEEYESNNGEMEMMNISDEDEYMEREYSKRSSKESEIKYSIKEMIKNINSIIVILETQKEFNKQTQEKIIFNTFNKILSDLEKISKVIKRR